MNLLKVFSYLWPLVREVLFNHEQERLRPLGIVGLVLSLVLTIGYLGWTDHGKAVRESFFPTNEDRSYHYRELLEERIAELLDNNMELNKKINRLKEEQNWKKGEIGVVRIRNKELENHITQLQSIVDTQNQEIKRLGKECATIEKDEGYEAENVHDRIRDLY